MLSSLGATLLAALAVALVGWFVADRIKPGAAWAAWPAAGAVALVYWLGLMVMRVWAPRPMPDWMRAYLAGQAVRFFTAIAAAFALLYSLPPSARAVGGVTFAAGYMVTLAAETWAMAAHFRRALADAPAP